MCSSLRGRWAGPIGSILGRSDAITRRSAVAAGRARQGFRYAQVGKPLGMTIGTSIFLIAVGAILRYATNFHIRGVDIDEVGLILMIVGAAAFVLSLLY